MSRLPLLLVLVLLSCSTVFGHFFGYDPYWQQRIAYNGAIAQQQQALGAQQVLIDQQNQANQQAIENQQQFDQQIGQQMDYQQQQIAISQQTQADAAQQTLQTAQQHQAVVFQQQQQAQLAAQQLAQAQAVVNQQKRQTQIVQAQAATAARQAAQAAAKTQQGLDAARQATAQLLAQQAAQAALPPEEQQRSAALLHQIQLQKDQDIVNKEAAAKAAAMNSAMNLQQSQEQAKLAQFALDQQLRSANARARQAGTPVTAAAMDAIDTDTMPPETELDEADEAEFDVASMQPAVVVKGGAAKPSGIPLIKPAVKHIPAVHRNREYRDEYVDGTDLTHSELVSILMSALEADNLPTAVTPEAKPAETELDEAGGAEFDVAGITPAAAALKSTATKSPAKHQTAKPHHDDDDEYQDEYVDGTDLTHAELVSIIMSALEADDVPTTATPEAEVDSAFTVADPLTVNTARTAATDDKSTDASRQHTSLVIGVSVAGGSLLLILFLVYFGRSYYLARREKNELESARRAAQGNLPLPYGHPLQVI